MHILRKNTTPSFEIVPRKALSENTTYIFSLKNEYTNAMQEVNSSVELLANENYLITMSEFPIGKINQKISFELKEDNEIVLIGQIMIVDENENVQDYSKKTNTKYNR